MARGQIFTQATMRRGLEGPELWFNCSIYGDPGSSHHQQNYSTLNTYGIKIHMVPN